MISIAKCHAFISEVHQRILYWVSHFLLLSPTYDDIFTPASSSCSQPSDYFVSTRFLLFLTFALCSVFNNASVYFSMYLDALQLHVFTLVLRKSYNTCLLLIFRSLVFNSIGNHLKFPKMDNTFTRFNIPVRRSPLLVISAATKLKNTFIYKY